MPPWSRCVGDNEQSPRFFRLLTTSLIVAFWPLLFGFSILTQQSSVTQKIGVYYRNYQNMPIGYLIDRGESGLAGTEKTSFVEAAFGVWQAVHTSYITFADQGETPVDINVTTIEDPKSDVLAIGDGREEIIFDPDGSVTEYFGLDSKTILGVGIPIGYAFMTLAGQETAEQPYCGEIFDGFVLINTSASDAIESIRATLIHEIGHFIGLGHTTVNPFFLFGKDSNGDGRISVTEIDQTKLPTMYPFSFPNDSEGSSLEPDDIAALSSLYPEVNMSGHFGAITGIIKSASDKGIFGASVTAVQFNKAHTKAIAAVSAMSGYISGKGGKGEFAITGLPAGDYLLYVEPVQAETMLMACENLGMLYLDCETNFPCEFFSDADCYTSTGSPKFLKISSNSTLKGIQLYPGKTNPTDTAAPVSGAAPTLPYVDGTPQGGFPQIPTKPEESGTAESDGTERSEEQSEAISESGQTLTTGGEGSASSWGDGHYTFLATAETVVNSDRLYPYNTNKTGSSCGGCQLASPQPADLAQLVFLGWLFVICFFVVIMVAKKESIQ